MSKEINYKNIAGNDFVLLATETVKCNNRLYLIEMFEISETNFDRLHHENYRWFTTVNDRLHNAHCPGPGLIEDHVRLGYWDHFCVSEMEARNLMKNVLDILKNYSKVSFLPFTYKNAQEMLLKNISDSMLINWGIIL